MSDKEKLQESIEFFDEFVNAALCKETDKYPALDVVRHYNTVKNELAKVVAAQE
jgi:hypothetical protein